MARLGSVRQGLAGKATKGLLSMNLADELMMFGHSELPVPVRTYRPARLRRAVCRVAPRVGRRVWDVYAAWCIASWSAAIVAGLAWWIYEELT